MAVGGDIIEITWTNSSVSPSNGVIYPKAGEDNTYSTGGFRSQDDNNMIAGGGEMIDVINQERWYASVTVANDMNSRKDLETLVKLASSPVQTTFVISVINGINYTGKGKPVGALEGNINKATFTLKIAGGGQLVQS